MRFIKRLIGRKRLTPVPELQFSRTHFSYIDFYSNDSINFNGTSIFLKIRDGLLKEDFRNNGYISLKNLVNEVIE
jgi:hypothetical protein